MPSGTSLTNKAVHDLNALSNIDAYDSVRLYELWLQQEVWAGQSFLRLGQMLADAEFFVSAYGALFINSSFGAIPLVSQNLARRFFRWRCRVCGCSSRLTTLSTRPRPPLAETPAIPERTIGTVRFFISRRGRGAHSL